MVPAAHCAAECEKVAGRVSPERVVIIVNPISGTGGRRRLAARRIAHARAMVASRKLEAAVLVSETAGHAPVLAREALAGGASLIVAWGGDGTMNEVASQVAFRDASFAIIPSGSGNGLARELGIPCHAERAFDVALSATERVIDAGEIDGRLFFNLAGVGLDARVAHRFADGGGRRGFARYIEIAVQEMISRRSGEYTLTVDGAASTRRAALVAIANGRQYGNGAVIAPQACLDDGLLDVVVVDDRAAWMAIAQMPMVFAGRIARVPGVAMLRARDVTLAAGAPMPYHVDGEPRCGGTTIRARVRPRALRVRVADRLASVGAAQAG